MCNHCHCFFTGNTCLVEHLRLYYSDHSLTVRPRSPPFCKYGNYIAVGAFENRWAPCIPGIGIKIPFLSADCACNKVDALHNWENHNYPNMMRKSRILSRMRWYALASCLTLLHFERALILKNLRRMKLLLVNHFLRTTPCVLGLIRPFLHPNNQIELDIQEGRACSIAPALYLRSIYNNYEAKNLDAKCNPK